MTSTSPAPTAPSASVDRTVVADRNRRIVRVGVTSVAVAAVVNLAVGLIAKAADVALLVKSPGDDIRSELPVALFAVATLVGGGLGIVLARVLSARGSDGRRFAMIAGVLTLVSLGGPLTADAPTSTKLMLAIAHVVAAAIIIPAVALQFSRRQ